MKQIEVNASELKDILTHLIKNNQELHNIGKKAVSVNIEGESGIGKTSAIMELAQELEMEFVKLNLAEMEEVGELSGFPIKEFKIKRESDIKWVSENMLPLYAKAKWAPTGEHRMNYATPSWVAGRQKPLILFLDDFSRANHMFMQAIMEICDRQSFVSWSLPKGSTVILSSNPDNGNYNVTTLDTAQMSRFININMKFDIDIWGQWAEKAELDSRCINFLLMNPELVTERYNARAFETFFNSIVTIPDFEKSLGMIQMLGEGAVGPEASSMFTSFINNKLDKLVDPKKVLTHENESYILGELNASVNVGGVYRADISSVLATRIVNTAVTMADKGPIPVGVVNRIIKLTTDCDAFNDDLKYFIVKELISAHKVKFSKLLNNMEVAKMIMS
jgi:DNA polymerase III delta prime subunit